MWTIKAGSFINANLCDGFNIIYADDPAGGRNGAMDSAPDAYIGNKSGQKRMNKEE